eukprot:5894234-Prymnesium_polylepis.1
MLTGVSERLWHALDAVGVWSRGVCDGWQVCAASERWVCSHGYVPGRCCTWCMAEMCVGTDRRRTRMRAGTREEGGETGPRKCERVARGGVVQSVHVRKYIRAQLEHPHAPRREPRNARGHAPRARPRRDIHTRRGVSPWGRLTWGLGGPP